MSPCDPVDYDAYWDSALDTYIQMPTHRHRIRFVLNSLNRGGVDQDTFVFDYGCGAGLILRAIRDRFGLHDAQLGGCDISPQGIHRARADIVSPHFYCGSCPQLDRQCDYIVCSEVIEHTRAYREILEWIKDHLVLGGMLVLTTPTGSIGPTDAYFGHVQHFQIKELTGLLGELGYEIVLAHLCGFPFLSAQKWLARRYWERVRSQYMGGPITLKKRVVFTLSNWVYYVHDFIPFGPQILIQARNTLK